MCFSIVASKVGLSSTVCVCVLVYKMWGWQCQSLDTQERVDERKWGIYHPAVGGVGGGGGVCLSLGDCQEVIGATNGNMGDQLSRRRSSRRTVGGGR